VYLKTATVYLYIIIIIKKKLIEEKVDKNFKHIGTGENFLNRTPMAYDLKSRIDKWDLTKLQNF